MGVLFEAKDEKTFYLAGDTIWYEAVAATIEKFRPGVIALNACAAETLEHGRLIMGDENVWNVSLAALMPDSISRIWTMLLMHPSLAM